MWRAESMYGFSGLQVLNQIVIADITIPEWCDVAVSVSICSHFIIDDFVGSRIFRIFVAERRPKLGIRKSGISFSLVFSDGRPPDSESNRPRHRRYHDPEFFPAFPGVGHEGGDAGSVQGFVVPNLSDRRDIRLLASEHPCPARRHFGL